MSVYKKEKAEYLELALDSVVNQTLKPDEIVLVQDGELTKELYVIIEEYKRKYASILHLNPDQESNDQTKAIQYLTQKGIRSVAILGATGKREDHTLGNISLLIEYHRLDIEARIYTDYGVFIPASGTNRFQAQPGSQVSIFSFGTQSMRSEGLRYPLRDFTNWWQGTLNEVVSSPFTIECEGDYLVFLSYQT